jgi:hypothetical protein
MGTDGNASMLSVALLQLTKQSVITHKTFPKPVGVAVLVNTDSLQQLS